MNRERVRQRCPIWIRTFLEGAVIFRYRQIPAGCANVLGSHIPLLIFHVLAFERFSKTANTKTSPLLQCIRSRPVPKRPSAFKELNCNSLRVKDDSSMGEGRLTGVIH